MGFILINCNALLIFTAWTTSGFPCRNHPAGITRLLYWQIARQGRLRRIPLNTEDYLGQRIHRTAGRLSSLLNRGPNLRTSSAFVRAYRGLAESEIEIEKILDCAPAGP